jgi:hypothetical protein
VTRLPWYLAGGLVVVVLAVSGGWLALRAGGDTPARTACPYPVIPSGAAPTGPSGDVRTSIAAPSGGAVSVAEAGFTQIADKSRVSIGAVIENSSSQVAYRTRVIFRAYTAGGGSAIVDSETFLYHLEIPIVLPGQRAVIGDYVNADPASFNRTGVGPTVARAGVDLIRTQWIPPADTASFPTVTSRIDPDNPVRLGGGSLTVNVVASTNACREFGGRGIGVVFHDAAGAVVGGAIDGDRKGGLCQAGSSRARALVFDDKLPKADLTRTEVSVFCDVVGSSFARPGPDQPNN